jgi:D-glycero-D-manno-heptose 1,7-bisphosphate phosphatase
MVKALFLDRDGVINIDYGYVYQIERFDFIDGIFDFVKFFQDRNYLIFIITNQSGIARGYYTENDFQIISQYLIDKFSEQNITINKIYHCPCHPDFSNECLCRKPLPKMILDAQKEFNVDLEKSLLVGDKISDIQAGQNSGIISNFLLSDEVNFQTILNKI